MSQSMQISPQQFLASVMASRQVMPGVFHLKLKAPLVASLAHPGQFAMLGCGPDVLLRRPLSFHDANRDTGEIAFLYGVVGRGTRWLAAIHRVNTPTVCRICSSVWLAVMKNRSRDALSGTAG